MVDQHRARAEIAKSREIVRKSLDIMRTDLPYRLEEIDRWREERLRSEPRRKREAREALDTTQLDAEAWNAWADQRADARLEAAFSEDGFLCEAIGAALAEERQRAREEIQAKIEAATEELRGDLDTLRREISSLRRELEQRRAFTKSLHQDAAMRAVEVGRLQDQMTTLEERLGPVADYFQRVLQP
jgi:hypothetical protein